MRGALCLLASASLLAACGSSGSSEPATGSPPAPASAASPRLTIAEALSRHPAGQFAVKGYVLALGTDFVRLCSGGTNDFPPFCQSPALNLQNLDPGTFPGLKHETSPAVWWSESPVTFQGQLAGNRFTIATG